MSQLTLPVKGLDQSSFALYSQVGGLINQLTPYTTRSVFRSIISHLIQPGRWLDQSSHTLYSQVGS